jgi:hypothetical protein
VSICACVFTCSRGATRHIYTATDNGGPADGFNGNMACNWPLRGMVRSQSIAAVKGGLYSDTIMTLCIQKRTLYEGGVRGVGLISGAGLTKKGPGVILDG